MVYDDPNYFSPEYLYGDQVDDILEFLCLKPSNINGQVAENFKDAIYKQIDRVRTLNKFHLPSFGEGFEWLNTSRPLSFEDLKNKIYVMEFFTYCCINCMHILPYLRAVEEHFANSPEFTVVGIHSPKFPNEKDLERVREAVIRNNIQHPVLNDSECKLWKIYGVSCWPTLFLVGPEHNLLFVLVGEVQIDKLFFLCSHIFNYFKSCEVELNLCALPVSPIKEDLNETDMLFPGNVSTNGDIIFVSDTGHNRLLLMSKSFKHQETIGSGNIGCQDGPFDLASFNSPHGTTWHNDVLYVADTGNHSIRKVCFKSRCVSTVFSREMCAFDASDDLSAMKTDFLSPWDVCIGPKLDSDVSELNVLYIAVAGSHQIWALDLKAQGALSHGICVPFAGSGKEENRQNSYRFKAGFAQPSGIIYSSFSPYHLYVADSESSTIKSIALKNGAVQTIIGGGRDPSDLFQFGNQDGKHINVKLQHPMSVCVFKDELLAVTDTYNHKIKFVNVKKKECVTYNTDINFCEPSGICVIGETLIVADTNNHRIVPVLISEDKISDMLPVIFDQIIEITNYSSQDVPITEIPLGYGGKLFCHFHLEENSGYEINKSGGQKWDVLFKGNYKLHILHKSKKLCGDVQPSLILQCPSDIKESSDESLSCEVSLIGVLPFCDKNLKVCCSKEIIFKIIVNFSKVGGFKLTCLNFNAFVV